jgi:hypothetical protein
MGVHIIVEQMKKIDLKKPNENCNSWKMVDCDNELKACVIDIHM